MRGDLNIRPRVIQMMFQMQELLFQCVRHLFSSDC